MPKKTGIAIVAVGAVLILSALLLLLYNRYEDAHAGQEAENLLTDIEAAIAAQTTDTPAATMPNKGGNTATPSPTALDPEMPVVTLDGYEYVGYVEIPVLALKLPVMADWDYTQLKVAPCRQFGSSRTDDLVIAAHNYERLSRDDNLEGESYSVGNQKKLLTKVAKEKGYTNLVHFLDDGISGVTMDRPGFVDMIQQIEQGKASAVFVKDDCVIIGLTKKKLEKC